MVVIFHTNDPLKIAESSCFFNDGYPVDQKKKQIIQGRKRLQWPCVFHMSRLFHPFGIIWWAFGRLQKWFRSCSPSNPFLRSINWLVGGIPKSTKICQNRQMWFVEKPPCCSPFVQSSNSLFFDVRTNFSIRFFLYPFASAGIDLDFCSHYKSRIWIKKTGKIICWIWSSIGVPCENQKKTCWNPWNVMAFLL